MSKISRHENFRRLAEKRMTRIFLNMNLIANLSNRNNYEYTTQEIERLFQAYDDKGNEIKKFFRVYRSVEDHTIEEILEGTPEKKSLITNFSFFDNNESGDSNDIKNIKFKSIAEKRMTRIFSDMNLIANLSNRNNYFYTSQEVAELFQAYEDKGKEIKVFFRPQLIEKFTFSN